VTKPEGRDGRDVRTQVGAATARAEALIRRSGELAGQIADTESEVAQVQDEIAENDASPITDQASEQADAARRFGAQERQVADRTAKAWSANPDAKN
jgi:phage shock protein A